jgi:hypothetical protein
MFGSATAGAAAAGLSGAAATSSALATLGGGAVAAGGMGMAGGVAALTIAPVVVGVGACVGAYYGGRWLLQQFA